jgi:UDP-2,3-diacylglucosamine pyrophosphatase LpxH
LAGEGFSGEFYSDKDVKIDKDNPKKLTMEDLMKEGVQIFFVESNQDVTNMVNNLSEVQGGRNKLDKLLDLARKGEIGYHNQEVGIGDKLQQQDRVASLRDKLATDKAPDNSEKAKPVENKNDGLGKAIVQEMQDRKTKS